MQTPRERYDDGLDLSAVHAFRALMANFINGRSVLMIIGAAKTFDCLLRPAERLPRSLPNEKYSVGDFDHVIHGYLSPQL